MFRPARKFRTDALVHELKASRALDDALADAEEWAAHAVALARVLRETKAATRRLDAEATAPRPPRTLH